MTVEKYRPNKLDDALARVAEECSEVIKIVCKAQRFGLNDFHPVKKKRNVDLLLEEGNDVQEALNDFFRILADMQPSGPEGGFRAALAPRAENLEPPIKLSLQGLLKRRSDSHALDALPYAMAGTKMVTESPPCEMFAPRRHDLRDDLLTAEAVDNSKTPWVVIDAQKQELRCDRCGSTHPLADGVNNRPVWFAVGVMNGFTREHKDCRP